MAPDFILPKVDGRSVRLYSELERGPVVVVLETFEVRVFLGLEGIVEGPFPNFHAFE
jgi:hypothetical protein